MDEGFIIIAIIIIPIIPLVYVYVPRIALSMSVSLLDTKWLTPSLHSGLSPNVTSPERPVLISSSKSTLLPCLCVFLALIATPHYVVCLCAYFLYFLLK